MFFKTALTFLAVGALSVSALTVRVARSPTPEPQYQELDAWMLKRDLSYDLFSREPEDWVEWAGFARDDSHIERPPKPPVRTYTGSNPAPNPLTPARPPPPPPGPVPSVIRVRP